VDTGVFSGIRQESNCQSRNLWVGSENVKTTRMMILVVLLSGCNKPTAEDYHEKIGSHLTTIDRHDLQVKQGHNFFWVMLSYSDPKTAARLNVLAKAPPENGSVAVEFRMKGMRGQAAVFQFQDNKLSSNPIMPGTPDEMRVMEIKATEIANAIYLACQ
jgi:hypothetical protein